MRRATLQLLLCPFCRRSGLVSDVDEPELLFGPVRCASCQHRYPVSEGMVDLLLERGPIPLAQRPFESPTWARTYERTVRPWMQRALGAPLDRESEAVLYRGLLGRSEGPLLDLGCGTGLFARRIAREGRFPQVIGLDVSLPMLEEALAQAREAGAPVDFVRAEAPALPFIDQGLGAVLQAHAVLRVGDLERLFVEVHRVLRPGGQYVLSTRLSVLPLAPGRTQVLRSETALRAALGAAGFVAWERLRAGRTLVVSVRKPAS